MPKEIRVINRNVELRASKSEEDTQEYVEGVGIVYDKEVEIWQGFFEKIRSGALSDSLKDGSVKKSFFNHNPSFVLSTTESDPALELKDEADGLRFKSPIPDTTYGNDLRENLKRKNVRGASFSFDVDKEGEIITVDEKGNWHREITKATLYEVGPVTNPAYESTELNLRSVENIVTEIKKRNAPKTDTAAEIRANREKEFFLIDKNII